MIARPHQTPTLGRIGPPAEGHPLNMADLPPVGTGYRGFMFYECMACFSDNLIQHNQAEIISIYRGYINSVFVNASFLNTYGFPSNIEEDYIGISSASGAFQMVAPF